MMWAMQGAVHKDVANLFGLLSIEPLQDCAICPAPVPRTYEEDKAFARQQAPIRDFSLFLRDIDQAAYAFLYRPAPVPSSL